MSVIFFNIYFITVKCICTMNSMNERSKSSHKQSSKPMIHPLLCVQRDISMINFSMNFLTYINVRIHRSNIPHFPSLCLVSLETVRRIRDQTCPYYPYREELHGQHSWLLVTDTPLTKHWSFTFGCYLSSRGPCYQYKPYQ